MSTMAFRPRPPSSMRAALRAQQTPRPAAQSVRVYRPEGSMRSGEAKRAALARLAEQYAALIQAAADSREAAIWQTALDRLRNG